MAFHNTVPISADKLRAKVNKNMLLCLAQSSSVNSANMRKEIGQHLQSDVWLTKAGYHSFTISSFITAATSQHHSHYVIGRS